MKKSILVILSLNLVFVSYASEIGPDRLFSYGTTNPYIKTLFIKESPSYRNDLPSESLQSQQELSTPTTITFINPEDENTEPILIIPRNNIFPSDISPLTISPLTEENLSIVNRNIWMPRDIYKMKKEEETYDPLMPYLQFFYSTNNGEIGDSDVFYDNNVDGTIIDAPLYNTKPVYTAKTDNSPEKTIVPTYDSKKLRQKKHAEIPTISRKNLPQVGVPSIATSRTPGFIKFLFPQKLDADQLESVSKDELTGVIFADPLEENDAAQKGISALRKQKHRIKERN